MIVGKQPELADLYDLIGKVGGYPVTARSVAKTAEEAGAAKSVVEFYRAFPDDAMFSSREDLLARSEQVEMLNEDSNQPPEIFTTPEED